MTIKDVEIVILVVKQVLFSSLLFFHGRESLIPTLPLTFALKRAKQLFPGVIKRALVTDKAWTMFALRLVRSVKRPSIRALYPKAAKRSKASTTCPSDPLVCVCVCVSSVRVYKIPATV